MLIRNYFKNLYAMKWENLKEMKKLWTPYSFIRLTKKEAEHLHGPITIKEIKMVIKSLHLNKTPGPERFTSEFFQTFKRPTLNLFRLFQKGEETSPTLFLWVYHYPDNKRRNNMKKGNYRLISDENGCKDPQNISTPNLANIRKVLCHDQEVCIPGMQGWLKKYNSIN